MKILFESKKGKQVLKTFKTIKEAKEFISKNQSNIQYGQLMEDGYDGAVDKGKHEKFLPSDASTIKNLIMKYAFKFQGNPHVHYKFVANEVEKYILSQTKEQVMEGPLGSGSLNPIKGLKQFKKGLDKKANYKKIDGVKDSFNKDVRMYILDILNDIGNKDKNYNLYGCGLDKHGWYIVGANVANGSMMADGPNFRRMDDNGASRVVDFDSEKYKNKIYMPKLTKYLEKHHSLPSEKQLRNYIEGLIDTRYKQNFDRDRKKNPERHLSRTDVENF